MYEEDRMSFDKVKELIDDAIDKGIWRIDFTGGEVFCANYFLDVLKYIDNKPISIIIFTNLTLVNEKEIEILKKCNSIRSIVTSVDYFYPEKHDEFRGGKGAFAKTDNAIKKLVDLNFDITVNTMIMDDNHDEILKLKAYFNELGVKTHYDTVINCGRAKCSEIKTNNKYDNVDFLYKISNNLPGERRAKLADISCGVGESLLFVDHNAEFQLCSGLTEKDSTDFFMGNTINEANSNMKNVQVKCNNSGCKYSNECNSGCRMRSLIDFGTVQAPDLMICRFNFLKEKINN